MKSLIPLLFILIVSITACHKNNDQKFTQVKKGMTGKQVVNLVGEPESKRPLGPIEWWMYSSDNKLIVVDRDTVVNVVMDYKATQEAMQKALGS